MLWLEEIRQGVARANEDTNTAQRSKQPGTGKAEWGPTLSHISHGKHLRLTESNLGRKGFILSPPHPSSSLEEVRAGIQDRNLEAETKAEGMGGAACWPAPRGLFSLFSYTRKTTCPQVTHPQWVSTSIINQEDIPQANPVGAFSVKIPSSQICLDSWQVD